jgi:hypothetical protein
MNVLGEIEEPSKGYSIPRWRRRLLRAVLTPTSPETRVARIESRTATLWFAGWLFHGAGATGPGWAVRSSRVVGCGPLDAARRLMANPWIKSLLELPFALRAIVTGSCGSTTSAVLPSCYTPEKTNLRRRGEALHGTSQASP